MYVKHIHLSELEVCFPVRVGDGREDVGVAGRVELGDHAGETGQSLRLLGLQLEQRHGLGGEGELERRQQSCSQRGQAQVTPLAENNRPRPVGLALQRYLSGE